MIKILCKINGLQCANNLSITIILDFRFYILFYSLNKKIEK